MFGTLGGPELFLIFVVALIVFGPRKLPEIGKSLGKMMGEFRRASNDFRSTIENEVEAEKIRDSLRIEPPSVQPALASHAPAGDEPAGSSEAKPDSPAPTEGGAATPDGGTPAIEPAAEAVSRESGSGAPEPK